MMVGAYSLTRKGQERATTIVCIFENSSNSRICAFHHMLISPPRGKKRTINDVDEGARDGCG